MEGDSTNISDDSLHVNVNTSRLLAAHWVPVCIVVVIIIGAAVMISCLSYHLGFMEEQIKKNPTLQANVVAVVIICVLITVYTYIFDIIVLAKECNYGCFPIYYPSQPSTISESIIAFVIFRSIYFLAVIVLLLLSMILWLAHRFCVKENKEESDTDRTKLVKFIILLPIASIVLIFGSTAISLTFHLPTITLAWSTDPIYTSITVIFYESMIIVNFYAFHFIYVAVYKIKGWSSDQNNLTVQKRACFIVLGFIFGILSFFVIFGIIFSIVQFVVYVPVNDGAKDGVSFIYNTIAAMLGALITFQIGWKSFSMNDVLSQAMNKMKFNPFDYNDKNWIKYSEEERMGKIVNKLITNGPYNWPPFQSTIIYGFDKPRAITKIPEGDVLVLEHDGKCVYIKN